MEFGSLLSRAFQIVRQHRVLWILGFLAALAGAGGGGGVPSTGGNFNMPSSGSTPSLPGGSNPFPQFDNIRPETFQAIAGILIAAACVLVLISIALWVVGTIANGGLIAGTDQIERDGRTTFGAAWARSAPKFWTFFGMRLLLALPALLIGILIIVIAVVVIAGAGGLAIMSNGGDGNNDSVMQGLFAAMGVSLCLIIPLALVAGVYDIISRGIKVFADRAIVLADAGATASIRQGWALFRGNFLNVLLMALLLWVISLVVGFITAIVAGIVFAPSVVLLISQINTEAGVQASAIVAMAISFLLLLVIAAAISALVVAYRATLWTLVYRRLTGQAAPPEVVAPFAPTLPQV